VKPKLAIVASGGGMTCSYSVGTLLALIEKYNITSPDIAIAASGSAGTMAYFVAGQYKSIRNIWGNLLSTKRFLNPLRLWKIIDIDYVIDQVFKKQDPLLADNIYKSPINFLIPYTNKLTGKIEYFSNKNGGDVFEALRATKAMPLAYGKSVNINGQNYCDTGLSANSSLLIEKAKKLGSEKVLVLDNRSSNPVVENGFNFWLNLRSSQFRKNYYSELERINKIQLDDSVFYLRPELKLRISPLNNNQFLLNETIEMGYKDTINNKKLENFLSK
jgi:predicted patatin/cPLA2 family phospholipase